MGSAPASLADNPFLITLLLEMQTTIFLRTEMSRKTEYVHNPCFLSANILKILGVFAENQKKESPKGKRHHRKREKGKPQQRKYDCFRSDGTCSAGWQQSFFPVCPAVCGRLFHSWGRLTHSAFTFRFRQKRQRKKKNHLKTRKSTSWHRRKRKGHCFICLNIV